MINILFLRIVSIILLVVMPLVQLNAQDESITHTFLKDEMVLQAGQAFEISGRCAASEKIIVEINMGREVLKFSDKADKKGYWTVEVPALIYGELLDITISGRKISEKYSNIVTGDVWLIVGGSNTVHLLGKSDDYSMEAELAKNLDYRFIEIPKGSATGPELDPGDFFWEMPSEDNLSEVPTIAHHLAKNLCEQVEVPIGVINAGYGGSLLKAWMPALDLGYEYDSELIFLTEAEKMKYSKEQAEKFRERFDYEVNIDSFPEDRTAYSALGFDDGAWDVTDIPFDFKESGLEDFDGVVWFRKELELPDGFDVDSISISYVDDSDEVFLNGVCIGGIPDGYGKRRVYKVPEGVARSGRNTIAIYVRDIGGGGGIYGSSELCYATGKGFRIDISKNWKYRIEGVETDVPMNDIRREAMLFNKMLNPVATLPVKGIVWYQGEVEAQMRSEHAAYRELFPKFVDGMRREFRNRDMPVYVVQLPSFDSDFAGSGADTVDAAWVSFKQLQEELADEVEHVEIVSLTDLINPERPFDIHVSNHRPTGERLAKVILKDSYGKDCGSLSPRFESYRRVDAGFVLKFSEVEELKVCNEYGYIYGFEVEGRDGQLLKVKAELLGGSEVLVICDTASVKKLRYCMHANSVEGNVYNDKGMPILPFEVSVSE